MITFLGEAVVNTFQQDVRHAVRQLRKMPGFTCAAVATLAIGIGATTAMFSIVDAVLLRPLPFPNAEQLVDVRTRMTDGRVTTGALSAAELTALNESHLPLLRAAGVETQPFDATLLRDDGTGVHVLLHGVTEGFLDVLGIPLERGPGFKHEDFAPAGSTPPLIVIVSHRAWRQLFGGDPATVGRTVHLSEVNAPTTIVGVAAQNVDLPHDTDFWYANREAPLSTGHVYQGVLRLSPGTRLDQLRRAARAAMAGLAQRFASDVGREYVMQPLLTSMVGDLGSTLLIVLGATALLLVLASLNVTHLLLARGVTRMREIAVRRALGGSRARIVRQLTTEAAVLASVGAIVGVLLAYAAVRAMLALGAANLPRLDHVSFVDARVAAFGVAALFLVGIATGLIPAWRLSGADLRVLLNESGRTATPGRSVSHLMSAMIVIEIALALTLVAGAGWLIQSYARLAAIDPGFTAAGRLVIDVRSTTDYDHPAQALARSEAMLERLRNVTGIGLVGSAATFPLSADHDTSISIAIEGDTPTSVPRSAGLRIVTPGFFAAAGIARVAGRDFTSDDRPDTRPVAIVNRSFVRALLSTRDPLTTRLRFGYPEISSKPFQVVGIVNDVLYASLRAAPEPTFYLVESQAPYPLGQRAIVVTAETGDPTPLVAHIRSALHGLDPQSTVEFAMAPAIVAATLSRQRLGTTLMLVFGAVALALAGIGIYGVIAYAAGQRRGEIATRIAIGASARQMFWLMMRRGQVLAVAGVLIGVVVAFAGGSVLARSVYAMRAADPLILASAAAIVAAVTLLATTVPAIRASRLDPARALRGD